MRRPCSAALLLGLLGIVASVLGSDVGRGGRRALRGNRTALAAAINPPLFKVFVPVGGGTDRACRGGHAEDNLESYYSVMPGAPSLDECKVRCLSDLTCTGIEYSPRLRRCETWNRYIGAAAPAEGFQCWRHVLLDPGVVPTSTTTTTTTATGIGVGPVGDPRFSRADGAANRACRGDHSDDSSPAYFDLHPEVASAHDCRELCVGADGCMGVEYLASLRRCELWKRVIGTTMFAEGVECWRFEAVSFRDMRETHGSGSCTDARGAFFDGWWGLGRTWDACSAACTLSADCLGFDFSPADGNCELRFSDGHLPEQNPGNFSGWWDEGTGVGTIEGVHTEDTNRLCFKKLRRTAATLPSTAGPPTVFKHRRDALVQRGDGVRLYAVGTSNVLWQTWVDQVHLLLRQMGYATPVVDARLGQDVHPIIDPICDDQAQYTVLRTPRVGRVGWASWGFAHDSFADCDEEGFRRVLGHRVSCINTWKCHPPDPKVLVRPSDVAEEAQHSNVTMVSSWLNDWKFRWRGNQCYGGEALLPADVALVSLDGLRRLIRAIHLKRPAVIVVVVALYPGTDGVFVAEKSVSWINAMNRVVREGLADEPNTVFADYSFPLEEEMFQTLKPGHPNCRGDKVMATAVVDALFRKGVLSHGLDLGDSTACPAADARNCSALSARCCLRSATCWPAADGSCVAYGPGQQNSR